MVTQQKVVDLCEALDAVEIFSRVQNICLPFKTSEALCKAFKIKSEIMREIAEEDKK